MTSAFHCHLLSLSLEKLTTFHIGTVNDKFATICKPYRGKKYSLLKILFSGIIANKAKHTGGKGRDRWKPLNQQKKNWIMNDDDTGTK